MNGFNSEISALSFGESTPSNTQDDFYARNPVSDAPYYTVEDLHDLAKYFNFNFDQDAGIITISKAKSCPTNKKIRVPDSMWGCDVIVADEQDNEQNTTSTIADLSSLEELYKYFFTDMANDVVILVAKKSEINNLTDLKIPAKVTDEYGNVYTVGFDVSAKTFFQGCDKLERVVFEEGVITGYLKSTAEMFRNCANLKEVDMSKLNLASLEDSTAMFAGCVNLTVVQFPEKPYSMENLVEANNMFANCSKLCDLSLRGIFSISIISTYDMFLGCDNLHKVVTPNSSILTAFNSRKR